MNFFLQKYTSKCTIEQIKAKLYTQQLFLTVSFLSLLSANDSISAQDVGIHDGEQLYFPSVESIKRELTFTAINGLKYYPSAKVIGVITSLTSNSDKDIKLAAKRSLMALTK